jgi:hypothetical protein
MPTTAPAPNVSHPNLDGVSSPETIAQSARDGVPISGRRPAPAGDSISVRNVVLKSGSADFDIVATGPGTARAFLWSGNEGYVPVWTTSCSASADPPPDYGFTACAASDGGIPPWGTDMSGRVVRAQTIAVPGAGTQHVSIPLDAGSRARLAKDGSALISFETGGDEVQAFDEPLAQPKVSVSRSEGAEETDLRADLVGSNPFPGPVTGTVQFRVDGQDVGSPVDIENGRALLTVAAASVRGKDVTAVYSGDGDYAPRTATLAADHQTTTTPGKPGKPAIGRATLVSKVVRLRGRRVTVKVACPQSAATTCNATVKIRTISRLAGSRRTLGTAAFQAPSGRTRQASLDVTRRIAGLMRGRTIRATVYIVSRDRTGRPWQSSARLTIKG